MNLSRLFLVFCVGKNCEKEKLMLDLVEWYFLDFFWVKFIIEEVN